MAQTEPKVEIFSNQQVQEVLEVEIFSNQDLLQFSKWLLIAINACFFDLYGCNYPIRPERAEALSPGQRPGLFWTQICRPVRAKALKIKAIHKAFALTGRLADCHYTQGVALG